MNSNRYGKAGKEEQKALLRREWKKKKQKKRERSKRKRNTKWT